MTDERTIEQRAEAIFGGSGTEAAPKQSLQTKPQGTPESPQNASSEASPPELSEGNTEATPDTAPTAEETFEFDIDGEKYVLPKKLEKSVISQKDYTQKSQTLAEQRRSIELLQEQFRIAGLTQQFEKSISEESRQLAAFDAALEQARTVDWASMTTEQMMREKLKFDGWKEQRDALKQSIDAKRNEFLGKQQEELKSFHEKALAEISKRVPNWNPETQKAIREHAMSDGYTAAELSSITDPRHALTLWKASQYDLLKTQATKKVTEVKSVKTTPSNPMPQAVKDKLAFHKQLGKTTPGSSERRKLVEDRAAKIFS